MKFWYGFMFCTCVTAFFIIFYQSAELRSVKYENECMISANRVLLENYPFKTNAFGGDHQWTAWSKPHLEHHGYLTDWQYEQERFDTNTGFCEMRIVLKSQ